jgi:nucleotide-binding universal stress UspA family protein
MFERIVAAINSDSERSAKVVEAARELALARLSKVLIAHVREVERPASLLAKAGAIPPALHLDDHSDAGHLVEETVKGLKAEGIEAEGRVGRNGSATAAELLDIADGYSADLIIVGDLGSTVSDMLQGGVAHRIVHLAECPVLVVR